MAGGGVGDNSIMREDLIKKACSMAMKAHKSTKYYLDNDKFSIFSSKSDAIFAFPGSWSMADWFVGDSFGEMKIDLQSFPSLRSISNDQAAIVNQAFFKRFSVVLEKSSLKNEVLKAMAEKRQVVFTGHSSGGPIAILATLFFLENFSKPDMPPRCVTFGSPLLGDRMFPHAINRENWSDYFTHFVMRYDIVPRIMLAPFSSIKGDLQSILDSFDPKSKLYNREYSKASEFYTTLMRIASSVASHAACNLMECTNLLLETVSSFVKLSPYRPFGTYIFCTGNGKLVSVKNPDAVLQLLFYCSQLNDESELRDVATKSLKEHLGYEMELEESFRMLNVVNLDQLEELPLSSDGSAHGNLVTTLNDIGVSTKARLCLRAAGEWEKQKNTNQDKIDKYKPKIEEVLQKLKGYQAEGEVHKLGYYDTFKLSKDPKDFKANVQRLELAGMWDEIIEMLKRYELPDGFEGRKDWIDLGTRYRRIVEPLDIANYYRHLKNEDTGPYLMRARPKRYRFTQRWLEHAQKKPAGFCSESCFWAEVEQCKRATAFDQGKILQLESNVLKWVNGGELGKDVVLEDSSFVKWWNTLPQQHRLGSCIAHLMKR